MTGGAGTPRRRRLSRSGDFRRAYRKGSSRATRHLVLYRFDRGDGPDPEIRLGVSVSRKLGDAVTRNRVKRVLKEAFWAEVDPEAAEHDFVLVARPPIGQVVESEGLDGTRRCVAELLKSAEKQDGRST